MGCMVERTDTGVEVEIHRFDSLEAAALYVRVSRGFAFIRYLSGETWGDKGFSFYAGPKEERASIRFRAGYWQASFWTEGGDQ